MDPRVQKQENGYKIKCSEMEIGEKCPCPDDTTEIEKIDDETVSILVKKGSAQKLTA